MTHTITIHAGGTTASATTTGGEPLLDVMRRAGIQLPAPCGGAGKCGKCVVAVSDEAAAGPRSAAENRFVSPGSGKRLACMAFPTGDLTVEVAPGAAAVVADTAAKGGALRLQRGGMPVVSLETVSLTAASLEDQRAVYQRLRDALEPITIPFPVLRSLSGIAAAPAGTAGTYQAMVAHLLGETGGEPTRRLVALRPGDEWETVYGLAVDIGTTTLGAYLIDLGRGTVAASVSQSNAQGSYGADVLSRIQAAEEGHPLPAVIQRQISELSATLAERAGIPQQHIAVAVFVGNTTMTHLFLGLDAAPIGRAPFIPQTTALTIAAPEDVGLTIEPHSPVIVLPGISAYVGADIISDLLVARLHDSNQRSLLIDIGTNGEIVLGNQDGLLACSTAAGPAFEGASIRNGSGGIPGAISAVAAGSSLERPHVSTIGDEPPASICGSGLIDAVALLLEAGAIDETGRLESEQQIDGEAAFQLADNVWLTQGDIRQVQLAKAAIAAGVQTLLMAAGWAVDEIERVYLSGGFGTFVRPAGALRVGLLPRLPLDRIFPLGNAAGAGAASVLLNRSLQTEAGEIVRRCRYIELSSSAEFQNLFIEEMIFA